MYNRYTDVTLLFSVQYRLVPSMMNISDDVQGKELLWVTR